MNNWSALDTLLYMLFLPYYVVREMQQQEAEWKKEKAELVQAACAYMINWCAEDE